MAKQHRAILVGALGALLFIVPSFPFSGSGLYLSTLAIGAALSASVAYLTILED